MQKVNKGMALITVLIFMQIWTLLGMLSLEIAWLMKKINASTHQKNHMQLIADTLLRQAESKVMQDASLCSVDLISTSELLSKPLSWWESKSICRGTNASFNYYYISEFISDDPCGYFKQTSISKEMPAYYRISTLVYKKTALLIQSTIVLPVVKTKDCSSIYHHVIAGRQMWRKLQDVRGLDQSSTSY